MVSACLPLVSVAAAGVPSVHFVDESYSRSDYDVDRTFGTFGNGVAIADVDRDGDQDIIACGAASGRLGLLRNDGTGHFEDMWATSGLQPFDRHSSVSVVDYDGDGTLDLYVARWTAPDLLLRHDGAWGFADVTAEAGLGDAGASHGICWGDFDGDGRLDVHVSNRTESRFPAPNRVYRATDDGAFEEVGSEWGVDDSAMTFQAQWVDVDDDGQPELYTSNDKARCDPWRNRLYRWTGSGFVDQPDCGAQICIDSMGVGVGDFDGDGHVDLYCANSPNGNVLLLGDGAGSFTHGEAAAGVESHTWSWATIFADFTNDGWLELFVANTSSANRLYVHGGVWPCVDMASSANVPGNQLAFGAATGDLNGDGRLDLVVAESFERLRIYINDTPAVGNYLRVKIIGNDANTQAIGARITAAAGARTYQRQVLCGGNTFKSQNELIAHFGLGAADAAELTVRWPNGELRQLSGAPANGLWHIYPDGMLGDADLDGSLDGSDLAALLGAAARDDGAVVRGTEQLDMDGDFDLDLTDAELLAARVGADSDVLDCDGDGVLDAIALPAGESDVNGDGLADGCQCLGDLTGDRRVDFRDLGVLLAAYGTQRAGADLSGDRRTDATDVSILLSRYLEECE